MLNQLLIPFLLNCHGAGIYAPESVKMWDMSAVQFSTKPKGKVQMDRSKVISEVIDGRVNRYRLLQDGVTQWLGEENILYSVKPNTLVKVNYAMAHHNELVCNFVADGNYCNDHKVRLEGTIETKDCGYGIIIYNSDRIIARLMRETHTYTSAIGELHAFENVSDSIDISSVSLYRWFDASNGQILAIQRNVSSRFVHERVTATIPCLR